MNLWVFLLLLGIVVVYILVQKNKKEKTIAKLKNLIYAADTDQIPLDYLENFCYEHKISDKKRFDIRKKMYLELADTTTDIHAINMAVAFSDDAETRQKYLTKASELGDAKSMCSLAFGYTKYPNETGDPVYAFGYSPSNAIYWYSRAAQAGSGEGMYKLAEAYADGEGVPKDLNKSISIAKDGAQRGSSECVFFLCEVTDHLYRKVISDQEQIYWLERVIVRRECESFAKAAYKLGRIFGGSYLSGTPITAYSDRRKAAYCFALAHFADDWPRETIYKTGYNPSQYELKQWQTDALNLVYNPR